METKLKLFKRYPWAFGFLNIFVISFTAPLLFGGLLIYIPVEMMMSSIHIGQWAL